jgi:carboxylesterase type B
MDFHKWKGALFSDLLSLLPSTEAAIMGNSISYTTTDCQVVLHNRGRINGLQFDDKSRRFAGIPYAQPPIGDLRWRKPQAFPDTHSYSSSDGVSPYDATVFGPVCPQPNYSKVVSKHVPEHVYDEDCLRLNIWTPIPDPSNPNKKWPVMIWFHGGWFQVGDPSQEVSMDPTELISTGKLQAVFVAVGYRLNIFGFLAGHALLEESNGESTGNYGLWDQRLAIDWVYGHIDAFGGDTSSIHLAGRSAGAYSVLAQALYDFRSAGSDHFRSLVMYSNAIPTQPKTPQECEAQFEEVCRYFGAPSTLNTVEKLQFMRGISATDLCAGIMDLDNHTFRPVTDSIFIQPGIFEYYRDGFFAKEFKRRNLRLFIGEVLNEDTLYAVTNGPEPNMASLQKQIANYYPLSITTRLLQRYQPPNSENKEDWAALFGKVIADGQVRAPSRYLVKMLVDNGVDMANIWRYMIAYRLSFITEKVAPDSFGVTHAMDRPIWK